MAKKSSVKEDINFQGCYGEQCKPSEVVKWLVRLCEDNFKRPNQNIPRWSGNIWGHAGCVLEDTKVMIRKKSDEGSHKINIIEAIDK